MKSKHDLISLFEHDLRANAFAFVARENRFPLFRIMLQQLEFAGAPLIPTFAKVPAEAGCEY
jgi:hypothetical protein